MGGEFGAAPDPALLSQQGCDPFAQTQRSKLQHRRARINQQINKEMRMRAGAENLFRATSNHKVKETVALELSYVNSNLQLLKEELEELNSSVDVYQNDSESISVPMIPLGLKETKELDLLVPLKDFISEHYGEEGVLFEKEIKDFMELRQVRVPWDAKSGFGLVVWVGRDHQDHLVPGRWAAVDPSLLLPFSRYDSLTGVPSHQRALAFEKGSVLFNLGALHTQLGARQDRATLPGLAQAIDAFQRAAGSIGFFGPLGTPGLVSRCWHQHSQVEDVYSLVHQTMTQPHVKDYVPFSWTTMVHVKSEHFKALSHYFAAIALCDCPVPSESELPGQEKAFMQFHVTTPEGPSLRVLLQDPEERRKLGKAHLKKAIMKHEEAMRIHGLCKILRKMDILQEVLSFAHKRSLSKYSEIDHEEDFFETGDAPDIHPGLKEGDYIVSVNGKDCRWAKHAEVVQLLKSTGDEGVDIGVITLHGSQAPRAVDKKVAGMSSGMLKSNKENSRKSLMNSKSPSTLLVWSKKSKRSKKSTYSGVPFTAVGDNEAMY
ncbi:rhophilin-1 [Manacus vitellinus]|uniref:rhophilin-1 n=1 Tax=Manacus vitellinus TaxID=328815 RepID=UPI00115F18C0|nr:rhophilin-1 [Manacus vitellinus]